MHQFSAILSLSNLTSLFEAIPFRPSRDPHTQIQPFPPVWLNLKFVFSFGVGFSAALSIGAEYLAQRFSVGDYRHEFGDALCHGQILASGLEKLSILLEVEGKSEITPCVSPETATQLAHA